MDLESLIAFADDKELFVLVYASAACDVVLLAAVLAYYTFRSGAGEGGSLEAAVSASLLLVILLVVLVLATLATYGRFAAVLRALSPGDRLRLGDLHSRPREQADVVAAIRSVLSSVESVFRAANPDPASLRALDDRIDELNRLLAEFPTFRDPLRELRVTAIVLGVGIVLAGLAAAVVPVSTANGAVVAIIVAAVVAALTSVVALSSVGALGGDGTIRVRRVDAEAGWSTKEVKAAVLVSNDSLGPAMNAFGVRTRTRLQSTEPAPEHRPFWAAAVGLLTVSCLVFAGGAAAAFNGMELTYVPLLAVAVCVAMPSVAVFVAFYARP